MSKQGSKITHEARERMQRKSGPQQLREALAQNLADKGPIRDFPEPEPVPEKRLT